MNLIAAVDRNWGIGKNGRLLAAIPQDQRLFRDETLGKVVVMGRKTLETFPGGQPLKKFHIFGNPHQQAVVLADAPILVYCCN